jgi:hypothetical protein
MRKLSASLGIGFAAGVFAIAGSAAANPLLYKVVSAESNASATMGVSAFMDVTPDLTEIPPGTDDFPVAASLSGTSNTFPVASSQVTADVGLPGSFNDGANGITISQFTLGFANLPGTLSGFGSVPVPLDLTGSSFQLVAFSARVSSLNITLDGPISSSLTPSGNPDEWLWAALASVTITGILEPIVTVPTVDPVSLGEFPFTQSVPLLLAGTFAGIPTGSQVTVGIPSGLLTNQNLSLPPINVEFPLDTLGLIDAQFSLENLVLADFSTAAIYRSTTPIPEPGTGALIGLGLVGLALRRRS